MAPEASSSAHLSLKQPLVWSFLLHTLLLGSLALGNRWSRRGEVWGGPGGAITIGLVGSLSGIPLPQPEVQTPSRVADETRGLYKSKPRPEELETRATKLPRFERNKPPRYPSRPSRLLENPVAPPAGAIPYGQGGTPSLPYTRLTMAGGTAGGLGFTGAGGDFAGRFSWYVERVRTRISNNWLESTVDPSVRWAPRVVMTFQILRDGTIANAERLRSSGNDSVDRSAQRAILDSSPLPPLPPEYNGSYVTVEFWFDFRR
jgi:protein TonB